MPFFRLNERWMHPEANINYSKDEFIERIAKPGSHVESQIEQGGIEHQALTRMIYLDVDVLFNGTPN